MLDRLPEFIDPILYAEQRRETVGRMPVKGLLRLTELLENNSGDIAVDFAFEKKGRIATVQGTIKAELALVCQNCLKRLDWTIDIPVNLGVVTSTEQADRLAEEFDPLWLEDDRLALKDIVEDEILLALPDFPKHQNQCLASKKEQPVPEEATRSDNPFSILAQLKNTGDS
jgi:uncharacterized protein